MGSEKVSLKKKLSYGCGDIFSGGSFLLVALMFLFFLTDIVGLDPALAGLIVLIGKFWDALTDPVMGALSDRTRTRFGRRRVYFLAGIIPVFFSFSALWMSVGQSDLGRFFYYLFAYILFSTVYTMVQVPYVALMPEITTDYNERASVSGIRLMFSAVSAIVAGTVPMVIINLFPRDAAGNGSPRGYMVMGLAFGVFYALPWILVFLGTEETPLGDTTPRKGVNQLKEVLSLFMNRAFRTHAGLFIFSQTAVDFLSALFLYYITVVLKKQAYYSAIMAALLIVPVIMIPVYVRIARNYSKATPMRFGMIIWAVAMVSTLFVGEENWYLVFAISALAGVGTSSSLFVPWTILPEVTDVDELISGRRREGLYGGIATFLRKVAGGAAVALLGFLLKLSGYLSPEELTAAGLSEQAPGTITALRLMFALIPTLFILIAYFYTRQYNISAESHGVMMEEIARRKSGEGEADSRTRQVCEDLSGLSYEGLG